MQLYRNRDNASFHFHPSDLGYIVLLCVLICIYMLIYSLDIPVLTDAANVIGPMCIGAMSVMTGYSLVHKQPLAIWTPYFWFVAVTPLFYVLGPLLYVFGSDSVRAYMSKSLPITVTDLELLRSNLLNGVGIVSMLIGARLTRLVWHGPRRKAEAIEGWRFVRVKRLTLWMLILGGVLQYALILPFEFGFIGYVLPGVIYNLGKLFLFGLMGMAYVVGRGETSWKLWLYIIWALQILIALIHFSKSELILTMLVPVLGFYLAASNMKKLVLSGIAIVVVYVSVAQFVHYGRQELQSMSGGLNGATVGQRFEILDRWISGDSKSYEFAQTDLTNTETGWSRLSYVNVQKYAMNRYDSGAPGNSLETAMIVLIPRLLWADKPATTDIAKNFYILVTGWDGESYLGLGLFGEGYWNLGWPGVILLGVITGVVFWMISMYAVTWMHAGAIEYMPAVFLGISMGLLGTTQYFANAIVGGTGMIIIYALFVSKILSLLVNKMRYL